MFRALLAKDLRRAWRNPLPWLINLALPLCITALIGMIFGANSESGLGRIRFAVVDEDDSNLTRLLRGALNQGESGKYLEPIFLARADALRQINDNALSAVVIIPTNFTHSYLTGGAAVRLELVKNPAQSIHPAVIEELLGCVVTALNAVARNLQSEFPAWRAAFSSKLDYRRISELVEGTGRKIEAARQYLSPPLVVYEKASYNNSEALSSDAPSAAPKPKASSKSKTQTASAIFAYLLPGMSAMFLLFLAGNAVSDLLRELRFRTFERYQTMRQHLLPFVLGKLAFSVALLLFSSAVMLGGGGLAFRVEWARPIPMLALTVAYSCFATALMAFFVALMPDERRAGALTNVAGMFLAMAGGCMFPREQLPRFLGEHVTSLLPSAWFVDSVRHLQFGGNLPLGMVLLKFAVVTMVLIAAAVLVFGRRFRKGVRP